MTAFMASLCLSAYNGMYVTVTICTCIVGRFLLMINALYSTIYCQMTLCGGLRVATISLCG